MILSSTQCGQKHTENEDHLGHWRIGDNRLLIGVADGVGSSPYGGSVARWLMANLPSHASTGTLLEAIQHVHAQLRSDFDDFEEFLTSGASIAFALVTGNAAHILWAGDAPVFHATEDGQCQRLTVPHSTSPDALNNWFSGHRTPDPEETTVELAANDVLTICSDGAIIDAVSLGAGVRHGLLSQSYIDQLVDESVAAFDSDDATIICYQHIRAA